MQDQLYHHIADIIQENRTWIKVVDTETQKPMNLLQDGHLVQVTYRTLTLKSFRANYSFAYARTWYISEYDIGRGLTELFQKDPAARIRADSLHLTLNDVEYIIEKASFGIIKLELFDYDLY